MSFKKFVLYILLTMSFFFFFYIIENSQPLSIVYIGYAAATTIRAAMQLSVHSLQQSWWQPSAQLVLWVLSGNDFLLLLV